MLCPVPFLIWFHHRSGSTHLVSLLDSHPDIACWKEIFYRGEGTATEDLFTQSQEPSVEAFLDHLWSYRWGRQGTRLWRKDPEAGLPRGVGFKLKYQQAKVYPQVLEYLHQKKNIKVIHLVRTNLLATLASAAMLPKLWERMQRPHLLKGESPNSLERRVHLEPGRVLQDLARLETQIQYGRQQLRGLEVLEVTYEDLLDAPTDTCRLVLEYLGLDSAVELSSGYAKVLPRSLFQTLSNAEEIQTALQGSRYETLLDRA